ACRGDGWC
nr:Chain C, ALA-CYS-ARG-GLY-ASP-GLY-TRP-CYS [Homo sapiens]